MTTPTGGIELPAEANHAMLQLAALLQSHPDEVLADAMDCLQAAHGVGPRERSRPMPRIKRGFSSWVNLDRSLQELQRHQRDLDDAFAMYKRACKVKMRYAHYGTLWNTLLKGLFAVLHADERLEAAPTSQDAAARRRPAPHGPG